jgi:hypothetical protein
MKKSKFKLAFVLSGLLLFGGCFKSDSNLKNGDHDYWSKRAWLDKTARSLRYGSPLSPSDDIDSLMAKPKEQVIDYFMKDHKFIDTVIDFNQFFLGLKQPSVYQINIDGSKTYGSSKLSAQSISSAINLWEGKDYFALFSPIQPLYIHQKLTPIDPQYNPEKIPDAQYRDLAFEKAIGKVDLLFKLILNSKLNSVDASKFCADYKFDYVGATEELSHAGLPNELVNQFGSSSLSFAIGCFIDLRFFDYDRILNELSIFKKKLQNFNDKLFLLRLQNTRPINSPLDILTIKDKEYGIEIRPDLFSAETWEALPNSSTNFNRKRAAYVLKTYFCDDLTPINVAMPSEHAGDKHASDPACASCHYKMDPMAGFFRNTGPGGENLEGLGLMVFNDQLVIQNASYVNYMNSWKTPEGLGRKWNIGYIRSAIDHSRNVYGENLSDLSAIINTSLEVKQCLTKRMAEYFLGKDQVYDLGWINSLAQKFEVAAKSQSPGATSAAFKDVTKELLLSQTFSTADPQPDKCYDFAPGQTASSLPCEISFIIQNNCVQCHSSQGASGGLDLSSWSIQSNGETNFRHISRSGEQQSKKTTFDKLLESLTISNSAKQMPMGKFMSNNDRAQIYKWLNKEAQSKSGGNP